MTTTLPLKPTHSPGGFGIDPRLGAAALEAQQPPRRTTILKPSSNSTIPVDWITESATNSRYLKDIPFLSRAEDEAEFREFLETVAVVLCSDIEISSDTFHRAARGYGVSYSLFFFCFFLHHQNYLVNFQKKFQSIL